MNDRKKEDPRVTRSKSMFKNAAIELLMENSDVRKLTVQKVAKYANLNRATFYLHFYDINDLLKKIGYDIFDDLLLKNLPILQLNDATEKEKLVEFLDYFYENRKILSIFFANTDFKKKLHLILVEFVVINGEKQSLNPEKGILSTDILASSLLGIITWWVKDGVEHSSEYIANQIVGLYR